MKKILILTVLILLTGASVYSSSPQEGKKIRIGIIQDKPFSFKDRLGMVKGIYPEIIEKVAEFEGWELDFVIDSWAGCYERLQNKDIDLMTSIVYTKERDKFLDFSKESVATVWGQIFAAKESGIQSIIDLQGKRVARMEKDLIAGHFSEMCRKFNVNVNFLDIKTYDEICEFIESGQVDAGVITNVNGAFLKRRYGVHPTPIIFSPVNGVFAAYEGDSQILEKIDFHLNQWKKDKNSIYYAILNKWYGEASDHPKFPYKLIAAIIFFSGGIVLFLLTWTSTLKRQVEKRTAQLKKSESKANAGKEKLKVERDKLQSVINGIGESLYIVDKNYTCEFQNDISRQQFGELVGKKCYQNIFNFDQPCDFCLMKESLDKNCIKQIETDDVEEKSYDIIFSPFHAAEDDMKSVVVLRDITEKKSLQAEAVRASHLASIGELAAGVAHEINNPVTGIISVSELLNDRADKLGKDKEIPGMIIREAERISKIVQNLLSFARDKKDELAPAHINDILKLSLDLTEKQILKDGIHLSIDIPSDIPQITVLSQEIQQVFLNLISNARFALNKKHPGAHEEKTLKITGELIKKEKQVYLRLTFFDKGIGIPNKLLNKITDPFFSTKAKGEGTGLGLSISHGIIESHGGRLSFKSREGKYTKAMIDLPLYRDPSQGEKNEAYSYC